MSTTLGPFDPTTAYPQQIDTQIGDALGAIIVHNLSPYELKVQLGNNSFSLVGAWGFRRFDITYPTARINWVIAATPSQSNPPLSVIFLETSDRRDELPPVYFGAYTRQTSIGNNVNTTGSGGTTYIKNDSNAPATQIIESTPSDQAVSAENWNNDASGLEQILSAGAQRIVRQNVRGNATTGHASVQFGDANEPSMTTLYGNVNGAQVTASGAQINGDAHVAGKLYGTAGVLTVGDEIKAAGGFDPSTNVPSATNAANLAGGPINTATPAQTGTPSAAIEVPFSGAASGIFFSTWDGTAHHNVLSLGSAWENGLSAIDDNGNLRLPHGDFITGISYFSGTGAGTFNHGLGVTPRWVGIISTETNSTETVGVDSINSTSVHVNQGAGGWPWIGVAMA